MYKKDQESGVMKEEITLKNILEYKSPNPEGQTGFMPTASLSQNLGQTLSQSISQNLNAATLQNLMNSEIMNSEIMKSEIMNSGIMKSEIMKTDMRNTEINNSESVQSTSQQEQAPLSRSPPLNTFGLPANLSSVLNALNPNNMQS